MRILIADDHALVRAGIRHTLQEHGHEVVGETADPAALLPLVDALDADLVILDISMGGIRGIDLAPRIVERRPETRVLFLSMHEEQAYVREALRVGASGYVFKSAPSDELLRAIATIASGGCHVPAAVAGLAAAAWTAVAPVADPFDTLTRREREVLLLAAQGLSNTETGRRLFISGRTVETHRVRAMKKLGLRGQTELVRWAMRRGLVDGEVEFGRARTGR